MGDAGDNGSSPRTLGDVLYPDGSRAHPSEREWLELVRAVASGDQAALHALYERAHAPVFMLALRLTTRRAVAEDVTLSVFLEVWRGAAQYEPSQGTVLGWIMNQARSLAQARRHVDHRPARDRSIGPGHDLGQSAESEKA